MPFRRSTCCTHIHICVDIYILDQLFNINVCIYVVHTCIYYIVVLYYILVLTYTCQYVLNKQRVKRVTIMTHILSHSLTSFNMTRFMRRSVQPLGLLLRFCGEKLSAVIASMTPLIAVLRLIPRQSVECIEGIYRVYVSRSAWCGMIQLRSA